MDEVPRLLLAACRGCSSRSCPPTKGVELGVMLVVRGQRRRSQVGWLRVGVRMRVVVVVEVSSSVGVGAALIQRVSGGRLGWVGVVGEVVVRGVG